MIGTYYFRIKARNKDLKKRLQASLRVKSNRENYLIVVTKQK